ncbi:hypothetical protein Hanom_Chr07g00646951 [Helianthus anomalus]
MSLLSRPNELGIGPIKLQSVSHNTSRSVKFPISGGMLPAEKRLYDKLSCFNVEMFSSSARIFPLMRLSTNEITSSF